MLVSTVVKGFCGCLEKKDEWDEVGEMQSMSGMQTSVGLKSQRF